MGRNKPRSRAVDVTKSLLQPTSITDHISVQITPNHVLQMAEDDLSPTQGSEAAFALRREGKLDASMKLCINWRQGGCHNHAACSFAHVTQYFGVSAELVAGGSGCVGTPGAPGRSGFSGSMTSNSPWPQRTVSLGGGAVSPSGSRFDEVAKLSAATAVPALAAPGVGAPISTRTGPSTNAHPAAPQPTVLVASDAEGRDARADAEAALGITPGTAAADGASDSDATSPPAVLSSEGLRTVLASLTATLANKAAAAAAVGAGAPGGTPADAPADGEEGNAERRDKRSPLDWLHALAQWVERERATGAADGSFTSQAPASRPFEDVITAVGTEMLGEPLSNSASALTIYHSLPERAIPAVRRQTGPPSRRLPPPPPPQAMDLMGRQVMRTVNPRFFSTAPTAGRSAAATAQGRANARGARPMMSNYAYDMDRGNGVDEDDYDALKYGFHYNS